MSERRDASPRAGTLDRRAFVSGVGAGAGLLIAGATGWPRWTAPHFSRLDYGACLARLDRSLSPAQRALVVRPWDDPSRQVTNTVALFEGPHIGTMFSAGQIALIHRLYETMVSEQGQSWLRHTVTLEGRLEGSVLALYSDAAPGTLAQPGARTQAMISGGHLLLRHGGGSEPNHAFGGPVAWGQQLGNGRFRVEGNAFKAQGDAANAFHAALTAAERTRSRVLEPPHELMVQPQGRDGRFPGVALASVSGAAQERGAALVETVLETFLRGDRSDVRSAIEENGGLAALHVAFYESKGFYADGRSWADLSSEERRSSGDPYWQVWRIEGPGCVVHFKGHPHVHAYASVVRDASRQMIGQALTLAPAALGPEPVARLLQAALRHETALPLAFHAEQVPARIAAGVVTTGVAATLDPFADEIVVVTIRGEALAPPARRALQAQGAALGPGQTAQVATLGYFAGRSDVLGTPERVDPWPRPFRPSLVDFLRDRELGAYLRV